jgi:tetratricopeptide (TPR) repeat protein
MRRRTGNLILRQLIGLLVIGAHLVVAPTDSLASASRTAPTAPKAPTAVMPETIEYSTIVNTLGEVRLAPTEELLFFDAVDGYLDDFPFLTASLVAGGIDDPNELDRYRNQFEGWVHYLNEQKIGRLPPMARVEAIFDFMHRQLFYGGYSLACTNLHHVFRDGRYNCVSGTILLCCLGDRFGLDIRGREITGHAMSRLFLKSGRSIDIEVTCPRWFEILDNPARQAQVIEKTIGYRPGKSRETFREVTPVELVATIYYNRGVDLLLNKQFAEALAANQKTLRLDPASKTAQGNLLATLNNWAIHEADQSRFAESIELLKAGLSLQPDFQTFKANHAHVTRRWAEVREDKTK